ncbi:alpha/beta hydrolase fold domain-containing protein [Jongsikchunia kroppenstedtii]|uniref:alpha/beta hydrolase fold domain-containing protein n=1 Tax=Jongsikchunia kroppenstedtii TaxID=1121721 RepID=UPI000376001C|nr:alpha/beta hydrolase fold domain-containing protein [Jongsikchunia kroppenstedtii]
MSETESSDVPDIPASTNLRAASAAALTRWTVGLLSDLMPEGRPAVMVDRGIVAAVMSALGSMPGGTRVIPVREDGLRGEWVLAAGVEFGERAGYYIHGSAYAICSARTHRKLVARLSEATGLPIFSIDYRLAPEHLFPTAAIDVENGYRWLQGQGYAGSDLVIAGDSAGGHLALDLLLAHIDEPRFQPAGVVLFSPLIDLTLRLAEQVVREPAMSAGTARKLVELYCGDTDPNHPRLRLDFTRAADLPPLLVQVGGYEMLRADARHLDAAVRRAGGRCTLEEWPGMMHVFQALPRLAPESAAALRRAADFVATAYADDRRAASLVRIG